MIAKIISSKSNSNFGAVRYSLKKEKKGEGELMKINNFPSFIDMKSTPEIIKDYLKASSKLNSKIRNPQFHAVISCESDKFSKEQLADVAQKWMKKMGYEKQPYIVVFHNDTANNHVHIVSSRVNVENNRKINDSLERYKSLNAIENILKQDYGISKKVEIAEGIQNYSFQNKNQLKTFLEKEKIEYKEDSEGISFRSQKGDKIVIKDDFYRDKETLEITKRKNQIKMIFSKYKDKTNNIVFGVQQDNKTEYTSQFNEEMKNKFGLEIVFHSSDGKKPFGYTVIDHKMGIVFKGSDVRKMKELFEFSDSLIDKTIFDILKKTKLTSSESSKALQEKYVTARDFMFFQNVKFEKADRQLFTYLENSDLKEFLSKNDLVIIPYKDDFYLYNYKKNIIFSAKSLYKDNFPKFENFIYGKPQSQNIINNFDLEKNQHYTHNKEDDFSSKNSASLLKDFANIFSSQDDNNDIDQNKNKKRKKKR